jgi:iron(II)-dependent oxidoreductase
MRRSVRSIAAVPMALVLAALAGPGCGGGGSESGSTSSAGRSVDSEQTVQQEMVDVPAGEFTAGSDEYSEKDEKKRKYDMPAFKIDKYETTNAMYKRFLDSIADAGEKKARTPRSDSRGQGAWSADGWYPRGEADFPVTNISYDDMEAFAKWAGKKMPQRPQWEKAARGTDAREWPWGNEFDAKKLNTSPDLSVAKKKKVGSYPEGASPYGCMDMAGNVAERTSSFFDKKHPKEGGRLVCGGSFLEIDAADTKSHRRVTAVDDEVSVLYGFRCVQD